MLTEISPASSPFVPQDEAARASRRGKQVRKSPVQSGDFEDAERDFELGIDFFDVPGDLRVCLPGRLGR
jgi:signal recognition particle receptor subunit beta